MQQGAGGFGRVLMGRRVFPGSCSSWLVSCGVRRVSARALSGDDAGDPLHEKGLSSP
jgi:hypothetical protein